MRLYETLFVVHPEKGARVKEFIEKFKKVIEGQDGTVSSVDEWGLRDLAYRIEKQGKGFYTLIRYQSTGKCVEEFERNLKLTDGIMRYLTVQADEKTPTVSPSTPRSHPPDDGARFDPRRGPEREQRLKSVEGCNSAFTRPVMAHALA